MVETFQSLIVAFVLAMTFRGFVTEGFVIPTGSMAPTLLGQHTLLRSDQTGASHAVGLDPTGRVNGPYVFDPLIGRRVPLRQTSRARDLQDRRMGDRILVLKSLYPFSEPDRFDVVVFKNPTDPDGESENYIKRLIGLPNEKVWLANGDVFAMGDGTSAYAIQRKPEYVQRAVWQPVYDSDYFPKRPDALKYYRGLPWKGVAGEWTFTDPRVLASLTDDPATLEWDVTARPIDDWTAYNMFSSIPQSNFEYVNDLRLRASIVREKPGLVTTFELEAQSHIFEFVVEDTRAGVRMHRIGEDGIWTESWTQHELAPPGSVVNLEFWHVDQALAIFIDGKRVVEMLYDWSPDERLRFATGQLFPSEDEHLTGSPRPALMRWHFDNAPVRLHRVRLDRDLYYRTGELSVSAEKNPTRPEFRELVRKGTPACATHPDKPADLGPDHFFMLGDNSAASLDSRLWGNPHPLIAEQIDPTPFVVNRKLLVGKAWVVYFPSPYSMKRGGRHVIPDFGRLRFIR
jgi:signal peptidase I